ncbi:MAG: PQQ-binding-like beta-propeller repeat protein [Ktedonobacteraceae bacterium]
MAKPAKYPGYCRVSHALIGSLFIVLNLAHQIKTVTAITRHHSSASANVSNNVNVSLSQLGVYAGFSDGALYKLDAQSGKSLWHFQTNGRSIPAAPAVAVGTVYLASQDGYVYALNASNGTLKWRFQTHAPVLASPTVDSGVVFVGSSDGYLYALRVQDGSLLWRYYTGPNSVAVTANSAVVAGGIVFGSSTDNVAHSYLFALDAKAGTQLWRVQVTYFPQRMGWKNALCSRRRHDHRWSFL